MDELPRVYKTEVKTEEGYNLVDMDLEIQRVSRELYKAFNGLNEGFKEVNKFLFLTWDPHLPQV